MAKEKTKESRNKKIVNIVVMVIEILIIIAGIGLSISVIFGSKTKSDELAKGINMTTVLSDSMDGDVKNEFKISSFKPKSDLLIIKSLSQENMSSLKVGDVITYTGNVGGEIRLISHRIVKIDTQEIGDAMVNVYYTLGDKQRTGNEDTDLSMSTMIYEGNIQGKVVSVIPKLGNAVFWFQEDSTHFLLAVVIPLALLLIYNLYLFIKMIIEFRVKKAKEESDLAVEAIKAQTTIDEEEIKRKAIEEYLAKQASVIKDDAASNKDTSEIEANK